MDTLAPEEWAVIEALAQCHGLMCDLPGLDFQRFDAAIQHLQDMVLALPTKRALHRDGQGALPAKKGK